MYFFVHANKYTDAHTWFRRTGLPWWAWSVFRDMKVGDQLAIIDFSGPGGWASLKLRSERGRWEFDVLWMVNVGRHSRSLMFGLDIGFKILPGRKMQWLGTPDGAWLVKKFLCRAATLVRWTEKSGDHEAAAVMKPAFFRNRSRVRRNAHNQTTCATEEWFDKLAYQKVI